MAEAARPAALSRVSTRTGALVGRDAELARLGQALASRSTLLVTGAPGLGKSALLDAAITGAGEFEVLRATGIEAESELPFAALHQLLRPLLPLAGELPERQRAALASALGLEASVPESGFTAFAAVVSLLSLRSDTRPLALAVDDAHWIDSSSLDALVFAARRLTDDPVAVLFAARGVPAALRAARFSELRLEPLAAATARKLVARRELEATAAERIVELARGVPLALVELGPDAPDGAVVERLFGSRIAALSLAAATAALIAALGDPDQADTILRAGAALGADWEEAERASVLRLDAGRIDCVHPLLRAALIDRAAPAAVRAAHAALADAGTGDRAAWHRAATALGPDEAIAAALERTAAGQRARAGHAAAARALERAADLSPTTSERVRRLVLAGESARRAARIDEAGRCADRALALAPDPRAELLRAHVEAWRGFADAAHRGYLRVASAAARADPELAALALGYAAAVAVVAGDSQAALDAALRARQMPQLSVATRIAVRESLGSVLALRGDSARARPLLDDVLCWYEQQPERIGAEQAAEALMWLGEHGRVRVVLDDVIADARRSGALSVLIQALVLRAELGYRTGTWQPALADAAESVALARDAGQSIHVAYALATRAQLDAARGEAPQAGEARELAHRHGLRVVDECARFALGSFELAQGRPDAALEALEPLAAEVARSGRGEPAVMFWPADLIEALIAADRRDDARQALATLTEQARGTGGAWALGVAARYRGVLDGDERDLAAAVAQHHGMPFEFARSRQCYGEWLRRTGRRIDARAQLTEALSVFEALGASAWAERARRELAASGQRARRGPLRDRAHLTDQELQIARVVAHGATNKEAAADLFLSPKTIETHLTRVYRKLGVRSRSELTAAMLGTEAA